MNHGPRPARPPCRVPCPLPQAPLPSIRDHWWILLAPLRPTDTLEPHSKKPRSKRPTNGPGTPMPHFPLQSHLSRSPSPAPLPPCPLAPLLSCSLVPSVDLHPFLITTLYFSPSAPVYSALFLSRDTSSPLIIHTLPTASAFTVYNL